jgi:hypothetical protein
VGPPAATHPLRSTGITPASPHYEAVRPYAPLRDELYPAHNARLPFDGLVSLYVISATFGLAWTLRRIEMRDVDIAPIVGHQGALFVLGQGEAAGQQSHD